MSGLGRLAVVDTPGSEAWSTKIRRRAKSLVKTIDQGFMDLAEIVYTVWSTPVDGVRHNACVCVAWGYETYTAWAEHELGLHKRKAERLKAIWEHFNVTLAGEISPHMQRKIIALGWTKVRELIRVIDKYNAEQWVEMAEHLNHVELCAAIRQALRDQEKADQAAAVGDLDDDEEWQGAEPPEDIDRFKQLKFKLTPEQKANVEMALQRARQLAESAKKGHCLDMICTDFLATNDFLRPDDPETYLRYLAKFERLMGKRFVVVDPKTWSIEYGMEALAKAAEAAEAGSAEPGERCDERAHAADQP